MQKKYVRKPIIVDAMKFTTDTENCVIDWVRSHGGFAFRAHNGMCFIDTLAGQMCIFEGSYVIRGVAGEFYPCSGDIFEASHEEV